MWNTTCITGRFGLRWTRPVCVCVCVCVKAFGLLMKYFLVGSKWKKKIRPPPRITFALKRLARTIPSMWEKDSTHFSDMIKHWNTNTVLKQKLLHKKSVGSTVGCSPDRYPSNSSLSLEVQICAAPYVQGRKPFCSPGDAAEFFRPIMVVPFPC